MSNIGGTSHPPALTDDGQLSCLVLPCEIVQIVTLIFQNLLEFNPIRGIGGFVSDMAPEYANVSVHPDTRDRLRAAKQGGESYDDVANRLLDEFEGNGAEATG